MNKLIKDTKGNYYTSALNDAKNNPKNMWNTINKLTNKKSKTTTITKLNLSNENVTENPNKTAHTFNYLALPKRLNPMLLLVIQLFN